MAGSNYLPQLLAWVDRENLPDYLGGTSTATLIDDAGPWQDPAIVAEVCSPASTLSQHTFMFPGARPVHWSPLSPVQG